MTTEEQERFRNMEDQRNRLRVKSDELQRELDWLKSAIERDHPAEEYEKLYDGMPQYFDGLTKGREESEHRIEMMRSKLRSKDDDMATLKAKLQALADEWNASASWMGVPSGKGPRNITDCAGQIIKLIHP
jgi:predicted RNase H-like nuclease (RuvC/YqgF family)